MSIHGKIEKKTHIKNKDKIERGERESMNP